MTRKPVLILFLSAFMLLESSALGAEEAGKQTAAPKADVYIVEAAQKMPFALNYPARLKSVRRATVVSRVTGVLMENAYAEGKAVRQGELLYQIEPDQYAALVNERKADLKLQEAVLTNAERDWERAKELQKNRALSQKDYDAAISAYETAKAEVNAAKARLESAKIDLGYTQVKAPISGIAGIKETDLGNVVSAGTPLVTITQVDPIHAEFSIPDVDFFKAEASLDEEQKRGIKAVLSVNGIKREGKIDYIAPNADIKTGSIKARAIFTNKEHLLLPGSYGRISIEGIQRRPLVKVPQKAILQNPMGTIVFVVQEGKAAVRPVKLGDTVGEYFIIEGGLKPGDKVIVNNFFRVRPGAPVAIDKTLNAKGK